jgi:hypothetical protein
MCSHLINYLLIQTNRLERYTILRSLILLLLQYDPLNLLYKVLDFTIDCVPFTRTRRIAFVEGLKPPFFTSLIAVTDEYQEEYDPSERFYECVDLLTLDELLIDLYFAINFMNKNIQIHFTFGKQEIVVYIESLYKSSELQCLNEFLTHFNKFRSSVPSGKHKPSIIKVSYNDDFYHKHSTIDNYIN